MTTSIDPTTPPRSEGESEPPESRVVIEREPSFARFVADQVLVVDLGRDLEFSFIQSGRRVDAKVRRRVDGGMTEGFSVSSSLTEVARARMSPDSASQFAMNIIKIIAENGELDTDALRENIEMIIAGALEIEKSLKAAQEAEKLDGD